MYCFKSERFGKVASQSVARNTFYAFTHVSDGTLNSDFIMFCLYVETLHPLSEVLRCYKFSCLAILGTIISNCVSILEYMYTVLISHVRTLYEDSVMMQIYSYMCISVPVTDLMLVSGHCASLHQKIVLFFFIQIVLY